jgi:hypothetical protein
MLHWTQTEYPPSGSDYAAFLRYHYQLFTGYVIAAICGASRRVATLQVWADWCKSYRDSLAEAKRRFEEPVPAPIDAGHHWEPSICSVAALMIFGDLYRAGLVKIRGAGPIADDEFGWILATPDALLTLYGSLVAIESKYKSYYLPDRPETEHLMQLHQQMRVLRLRYIYIAYGHRRGGTEAASFVMERVFSLGCLSFTGAKSFGNGCGSA